MCNDLYARAIQEWGAAAQVCQTMEECGELVAALNRYFMRGRGTAAEVASEIADVEIMCAQLRLILGTDLVELEKVEKLARLQEKLANT